MHRLRRLFPQQVIIVFMVSLAAVLGLFGLGRGAAAQSDPAAAARGNRWVPFTAGAPASLPSLVLVQTSAAGLVFQADIPGVWVGTARAPGLNAEMQSFTRLSGAGFGQGAVLGQPDLPVLRRAVEIPFGAQYTLDLGATRSVEIALADIDIQDPLLPLQPPESKCAGGEVKAGYDAVIYHQEAFFPNRPLATAQEYVTRGHRVLVVEVWPVAYNPVSGRVRLYSQLAFTLRLASSDLEKTDGLARRYASLEYEARLGQDLLNFNQGRGPRQVQSDPVGYLIIAADAYVSVLEPFVNLKESRGFTVTLASCSAIGGCTLTANVKAYIQNAYDTWLVPPSYVLLVGDTNAIATYTGPIIGTSTDLYYATMDGASDWHPDLGRGRFPVRSGEQATAMVNKYLAYAGLTGQEAWLKKAAFPATCDNYTVAEGTHNYVVSTHTLPAGFSGIFPNNPQPGGDKLYCVTYSAGHQDLIDSFNDGRWAIIYSGHGNYDGWEMDFTPTDVSNLDNIGTYPFVASHACLSGDFGQTEVFGETWVLQVDKGALVYWGSSTYSYWDEDDILERGMFDALFEPTSPHANVAAMTDAGLAQVELDYPGSARYYWETYNVLGDPAVRIFMEPDLPAYTLAVTPAQQAVCSVATVSSTVAISSSLDYSEMVSLALGPTLAGITATLDLASAPAPFTTTLNLTVGADAIQGESNIEVFASDPFSLTAQAGVLLRVVEGQPAAPVLLSPPDGAGSQPLQPQLSWEEIYLVDDYRLQLGDSPLFEQPLVAETGLTSASYTVATPLDNGRCYWWRAGAENACGAGAWTEPFHFAALTLQTVFFDDMEAGAGQWTHSVGRGADHWQLSDDQAHSPQYAWFVPDDAVVTDSRLYNTVPLTLPTGSTLSFWHQYQFEGAAFDGAVLELSQDGSTWTDLGPAITENGYNTILRTGYQNPLGGRAAWGGDLNTWTQVIVDLSAYAGQAVQIRWRLGCDKSVDDTGWLIDDVQITAPQDANPLPALTGFAPAYGLPGAETPVLIYGGPFVATPSLRLSATWLLSVTQTATDTLSAVVPAGLPNGVYTATLYNGDCQEALLVQAFTVSDSFDEPISGLVLTSDSPGQLGTPTIFTATITGGTNVTYLWDFGAGGKPVGGGMEVVQYLYAAPGLYTATVTATNTTNAETASTLVQVVDVPIGGLRLTTSGPAEVGETVLFSASVLSGTNVSYTWDFGDGPPLASGPEASHVYLAPGDYLVMVTATNSAGSDSQQALVNIKKIWRLFAPLFEALGGER